MFIIWGTHAFKKIIGATRVYNCNRCGNANPFQIIRIAKWFTLFWIPLFPVSIQYFIACPVCQDGVKVKKEEAMNAINAVEMGYIGANR